MFISYFWKLQGHTSFEYTHYFIHNCTLLQSDWATSPTILEGSVTEYRAQRVRLDIRRYRVQIPLWPLAGFVLGPSKFKSSSTFVNRQLAASCQLGFLILLCSTHLMLRFLLFEWSACKLYLLYLVLYTHFINCIICKYAIQPLGCNVLVIKLSIYLSTYLNLSSALSTINQTLTFNLVSVQCFFIHRKGGWRLSDHWSPIYRVLGVLLPVRFIWLLFTFLILTVCISVQLCTAEVLYIVFGSLHAASYRVLGVLLPVRFIWLLFTFLILTVCISVQLCTAEVLYIVFGSLHAASLILQNGKRKKKETAHTQPCLVHEWIATLRCSYWNVN